MKMEEFKPDIPTLCKLGSIVVHCQEFLSSDGHYVDKMALESLLKDKDVNEWLDKMNKLALLPVKRSEKPREE